MLRPFRSVILGRFSVSTAPWRMLMAIPIVVVPYRANFAGIGFEEEARHGEDAHRLGAANRAH
jgi:hypothetical protein